MKLKTLFVSGMFFVSLVFLPILSGAANVNWTTETYVAATCADDFTCSLSYNYGPPLPVSNSDLWYMDDLENSSAYSSITDSIMQISASRTTTVAAANAVFYGTFYTSQPYFAFTYDLTSDNTANWLRIDDLTDSASLIDQSLNDGASTVYVPVFVAGSFS